MNRFSKGDGFTLVEIMIVVVIIGLLAGIAIPTFLGIRQSAQTSRMVNDFRTFKTAFEVHAFELGYWPDDVNRGVIPPTVEDYLKGESFTERTPIGGFWDWDFDIGAVYAAVSVVEPTAGEGVLRKIDSGLDDGVLTSGSFRRVEDGRYSLILEDY